MACGRLGAAQFFWYSMNLGQTCTTKVISCKYQSAMVNDGGESGL